MNFIKRYWGSIFFILVIAIGGLSQSGILDNLIGASNTDGQERGATSVTYNQRCLDDFYAGAYEHALANCNRAIEMNPNVSVFYNNRCMVYDDLEEHALALEDCNKAIVMDPIMISAYINRGDANYGLENYDDALKDYNIALERDPNNSTAYNNRGLVYHALGDYDQAIADYTKSIELCSHCRDPHVAYANRGNGYRDIDELDLAMADYDMSVNIEPRYAYGLKRRGDLFDYLGETDLALEDYTNAITHDPKYEYAYLARADIYEQQKRYTAAIADYEMAIRSDPDDASNYYDLAYVYSKIGRNEEVVFYMQKAAEFDTEDYGPDHWLVQDALDNLAGLEDQPAIVVRALANAQRLISGGHSEGALIYLNYVIEQSPDYSEAYFMRGNVYDRLKMYAEAVADYEQYIAMGDGASLDYAGYYLEDSQNYLDIMAALPVGGADALLAAYGAADEDDYETAVAQLTTVIELAPNFLDAYLLRAMSYEGTDDFAAALADYEHFITTYGEPDLDTYYDSINAMIYDFTPPEVVYTSYEYDEDVYYYFSEARIETLKDWLSWPDGAIALYREAQFSYGDDAEPIDRWTEFIELVPDYADAYQERGWYYWNGDDYAAAIADYERYIALADEDTDTSYIQGRIHEMEGILALPDDARAALDIAKDLYYEDDSEATRDAYTRVIELAPDYADAYYWRGRVYLYELDDQEAAGIADWETFLQLADEKNSYRRTAELTIRDFQRKAALSDEAQELLKQAEAIEQYEEPEAAIALYQQVIDLEPEYPESYYEIGDIYNYYLYDNAQAAAYYRLYLERLDDDERENYTWLEEYIIELETEDASD